MFKYLMKLFFFSVIRCRDLSRTSGEAINPYVKVRNIFIRIINFSLVTINTISRV